MNLRPTPTPTQLVHFSRFFYGFINAANLSEHTLMWQVVIHVVFLFSALAMALVDKTMTQTLALQHQKHH